MPDQLLIGRSAETGRLRGLVDPGDGSAGRALVVLGEAGIGKSALLADLAGHAGARGLRVLSAAGREQEASLAFTGLQQLLRPLLVDLLALPGQEAGHLRATLGLEPADTCAVAPDRLIAGAGLLQVLAAHAGPRGGLLVLVDDAQWMDSASLEVLGFAAHRLGGQLAIVLAARGSLPAAGFRQGIPVLQVGPLAMADARELLDAQPHPPQGRARAEVLTQAGGNPLALIELARAVTADPAGWCWAGLPLPLTDRLSRVFAAALGKLPAATRELLLVAAAAGSDDRDAVARAMPGLVPAALTPAEELGLITVSRAGARFRHPLIRSAVYHDAPFASRATAHRQLAGLLGDRPDRRAWHLGAAALQADEQVAKMLAATAPKAQERSGATAAVLALERAADLSPAPADQARRLVAAAETAARAGQTGWARDLAARALGLAQDRDLRSRARYATGWALAWSGRYTSGTEELLSLARDVAHDDPAAAWKSLALAATAAYQAGSRQGIGAIADMLARLPAATAADDASASRLWALAVTGRVVQDGDPRSQLSRTATGYHALSHAGAAAWLLDQTSNAIALLHTARSSLADPDSLAADGGPLVPLGWAYLDAGRWDDALELAAVPGTCPGIDVTAAAGHLITATIEAARGRTGRARALISAALAADREHGRLVTARAWHALGQCALADGDYPAAFAHLRHLFADDGSPYHYHASYLAVGDLALAAARAGRRLEGREILKQVSAVLDSTGPAPSLRLRQLLARAHGILADPSTPSAYPDDILGDPSGGQWPFERAQLHLEYGQWLRRRRRINNAKPVLGEARDVFRALQAGPWARRAEAELRACGVAVPRPPDGAAGLDGLTAQQQQVIRLAAQGLSNREIAQRLFLSPRTVASHLYRSFPKLGVAGRHQLQGLLAQADSQQG